FVDGPSMAGTVLAGGDSQELTAPGIDPLGVDSDSAVRGGDSGADTYFAILLVWLVDTPLDGHVGSGRQGDVLSVGSLPGDYAAEWFAVRGADWWQAGVVPHWS